MNMQLASLKVFCNRNLVVEIGKYLDLRELPALLINKSVREFLLEPRYWRLQACVLGISQLPRDPRFYYEAVKTHAEKRDLKASIGGCLDRGGIKLDFGELEEVRKGIGKMLLQDVLPEFTYRQVLVLIRNNGDKIKPIIHLFYTSKVFEPILLFSNELSDRDRLQSISSACWEKRLDIIPQLRPDLLSNEARRELFLCYHCNKIQKELLESGSILPVPQADALSCLRKLHELKNYELIKQISQTLTSEARGKAILEFLPTIKREEDLEGIFIIFNSGNNDSPD